MCWREDSCCRVTQSTEYANTVGLPVLCRVVRRDNNVGGHQSSPSIHHLYIPQIPKDDVAMRRGHL